MSWLDKIKSWFRGGLVAQAKGTLFIADAAVLMGSNRTNGRLSPKDQLQMLRRISLFAEREGVEVWALFEGRPLREVAHGDIFANRVRVFFADTAEALTDMIKDLAQKHAARSPLAVIANRRLEDDLTDRGIRVMRGNTFRKAVELAISSGTGFSQQSAASDSGGSMRRQKRRRKRRGKPSSQQIETSAAATSAPQSVAPEASKSESAAEAAVSSTAAPAVDDDVRKLLDLVE